MVVLSVFLLVDAPENRSARIEVLGADLAFNSELSSSDCSTQLWVHIGVSSDEDLHDMLELNYKRNTGQTDRNSI